MHLRFKIDYQAGWGQEICLLGHTRLTAWTEENPLVFRCEHSSEWSAETELSDFDDSIAYCYALRLEDGTFLYEARAPRFVRQIPPERHPEKAAGKAGQNTPRFSRHIQLTTADLEIEDYWQQPSVEDVFLSSGFTGNLFARPRQGSNPEASRQRTDSGLLRQDVSPSEPLSATGHPSLTDQPSQRQEPGQDCLVLQILLPCIESHQRLGILGNHPLLGEWQADRILPLDDSRYPLWQAVIPRQALAAAEVDHSVPGGESSDRATDIRYKYVIYEPDSGRIVDLEDGEDRRLKVPADWFTAEARTEPGTMLEAQSGNAGHSGQSLLLRHDFPFRYSQPRWRGAGTAIPLFSLRSRHSLGIGEFADLRLMIDWAARTGQRIIQTLPVNDTTLYHNRRDSYPYNAVSVFALNPIFINIEDMGSLPADKLAEYRRQQARLNGLEIADYEQVARTKDEWFRLLWQQDGAKTLTTEEYQAFYKRNRHWLADYAVFCRLRDLNGTPDYRQWPYLSCYDSEEAARMVTPGSEEYEQTAYYCFLQYHADRQLRAAHDYARSQGIMLKGDIPIGISPDSVDAWVHPELFNLEASAGAPPDDFSISGQNWGFPTYRWDEMAKDGFQWWRQRFQKMADYFDAYRIDHILGFFRIWENAREDVWGLRGRFSPALPYSLEELQHLGIDLDLERLVEPYICSDALKELFGKQAKEVKETFLDERSLGLARQIAGGTVLPAGQLPRYRFKPAFDTQRKVKAWLSRQPQATQEALRDGLYLLLSDVLFVRDLHDTALLHPRISMAQSYSYKTLSPDRQQKLSALYEDFFYHRHNEFWKQSALQKLPALAGATDMLVCGEDLGMVPACVPEVMQRLGILSLEIQRMPKSFDEFGDTARMPWLSVCTTGTHDMNPLRAWWEEDQDKTQRYYHQMLGKKGIAPAHCTAGIVADIVRRHLQSPAMWVILPWQDWVGTEARLQRPDAGSERINVPTDSHNYWCYRMHIHLEDLLQEASFNKRLHDMIRQSGR